MYFELGKWFHIAIRSRGHNQKGWYASIKMGRNQFMFHSWIHHRGWKYEKQICDVSSPRKALCLVIRTFGKFTFIRVPHT